ncbi:MAG: vWA domain-containing protein [Bacillota bacterium]
MSEDGDREDRNREAPDPRQRFNQDYAEGVVDVQERGGARVPDYLENNLVKFIQVLRHLGIRVSSAEALEGLQAVELVDIMSRPEVKTALRATLVKDLDEIPIFDRAFDLFFVPEEKKTERLEVRTHKKTARAQQLKQAEDDLKFQGDKLTLSEEQRATYARLGDTQKQKLKDFLAQSSGGHKVDKSFQPMIENIVRGHLERWRHQMEAEFTVDDEDLTGDEELDEIIEQILAGTGEDNDPILYEDMRNIPDKDIPKVTLIIKRLTRRLATRISRRYRMTRKRQRVDLRRTIRSSIRYGGAPFDLKFKSRRVQKPKILLICDVSGSMARYASFILQFIYGLSSVVRGIESFIFSENLERVTPYFETKRPFEETMAEVINHSVVWGKGTDLVTSLQTFRRQYKQLLSSDTILIIVSDTKTLAANEAAGILAAMRRRVRDVIWLNTLPHNEWGGLGSVEAFRKNSEMFECYTLDHLERIMRRQMARRGG